MALPWFRMYAEAIDDDKLRLLAFEDRWHFVAVLCLKAMGVLDEKDESLRNRRMAIRMGLDVAELGEVKRRLETVGLVSSTFQPLAWKRRQFVSDSSTRRVQQFRKRQRNVSETDQNRTDTEQKQNRTEKNQERADARGSPASKNEIPEGLNLEAWEQWQAYRKLPPKSIPAAQRKLARMGSRQLEAVEHSIASGYKGVFDPRGAKASNGRSLTDHLTWRPTE